MLLILYRVRKKTDRPDLLRSSDTVFFFVFVLDEDQPGTMSDYPSRDGIQSWKYQEENGTDKSHDD